MGVGWVADHSGPRPPRIPRPPRHPPGNPVRWVSDVCQMAAIWMSDGCQMDESTPDVPHGPVVMGHMPVMHAPSHAGPMGLTCMIATWPWRMTIYGNPTHGVPINGNLNLDMPIYRH